MRIALPKPDLRSRALRVTGLTLWSALAACACSSNESAPGLGAGGGGAAGAVPSTAGTPGAGGMLGGGGTAGATAGSAGALTHAGAGGVAGVPGSAGSKADAAGASGVSGGGTSSAAGTSGMGAAAGTGGTSGTGAAAGTGGMGAAGGIGGMGAVAGLGGMGGAAGTMDCAGHALSLSKNGTGTASDGAAAHVAIDLMDDLPIDSSNRTVEYWAYTQDSDWTANTNTMFFYGPFPSARNADGFGLDFGAKQGSTGTIDPFTNAIFDNDNQPSGVTSTNPQWVHFAMTWNGTAVQAYVNGVLRATMAAPGSSTQKVLKTGSSPVTIGGYPGENAYFAGLIDEFQIWNVARSADDIMSTMSKTLTGAETGLVGYWQFNESSGTSASDSVTTANHSAHVATLTAASAAQNPTFVLPNPATPVSCP